MIQHEKEYNGLLDALLPFGQQMLNKHGEFYPYAFAVYFPYRKRFLRGFQFEKPFAQASEPRIFER